MSITNLTAVAFDKLEDSTDGDRKAIEMYLHLEVFKKESGQNFSVWAHRMAKRFNDPKNPAVAASRFKLHCEELVRHACSHNVPDAIRQTPKKFGLDNNSGFAQAFKKLFAAMNLGADLSSADFDTVSKCGRWAKEKQAEIAEQERQRQIKEYLKSQGIDENSDEGKRLLGLPTTDGPTDAISIALANLEKSLRENAKVAPEGQCIDQVETLIRKIDESTQKILAQINEQAAKKAAGL